MDIDELKKRRHEDTKRLREQMKKDWMERVKEKMIDVAVRFGIKWDDDAKVKSRRLKK